MKTGNFQISKFLEGDYKMKFAYLQKTSLQDFPEVISCIIFLGLCNFRCPACYNSEILELNKSIVKEKEIFDFLEKRKGKIDGVVITGGEPLVNDINEFKEFLKKIKQKGYKIKIDTNGSFPDKLKQIIDGNLVDYVAMDVKADKKNYDLLAGVKVNLNNIEKSMKILSEAKKTNKIDYELRTTLSPIFNPKTREIKEMSKKEIEEIGKWVSSISKEVKFFLQPFVPVEGRLLVKKLEREKRTKTETLSKMKQVLNRFLGNVYIRE